MLGLASVVLLVVTRATPIPRGAVPRAMLAVWILVLLVIVATMGALIVARQPANLIGWSFVAAGLGLALQAFATQYAIFTLRTDPGALPGGAWLVWVANWLTTQRPTAPSRRCCCCFPPVGCCHLAGDRWPG
jgi:hypothetical protein